MPFDTWGRRQAARARASAKRARVQRGFPQKKGEHYQTEEIGGGSFHAVCAHRAAACRVRFCAADEEEPGIAVPAGHVLQPDGAVFRHPDFHCQKGGYSRSIINFLFFSQALRNKLQYLFITLDALGYIIAVGRYLFPLFLLESALQYSMIGWIRRHPDIQKWICVLPAATLAVYLPPVFRFIVNRWPVMHSVLVEGSYWWITAYVAVALVLMIQELSPSRCAFAESSSWALSAAIWRSAGCICSTAGRTPRRSISFTATTISGTRASAICNTRRRSRDM